MASNGEVLAQRLREAMHGEPLDIIVHDEIISFVARRCGASRLDIVGANDLAVIMEHITDEDHAFVTRELKGHVKLKELRLQIFGKQSQYLSLLVRILFLAELEKLQIQLRNTDIGDAHLISLARAVKQQTELEWLHVDVGDTKTSDRSFECLFKYARRCTKLKRLEFDMRNTKLAKNGVKELTEMLEENLFNLRSLALKLQGTNIGADDYEALAEVVMGLDLKELDFPNPNPDEFIDDRGLECLQSELKRRTVNTDEFF